MTYMCMKTKYGEPVADELESESDNKSLNDVVGGCSPLTEEDSNYDSDYEGSEEQCQYGHEDISRTVSDTLGQEFSEYVFTCPSTISNSSPDSFYQNKLEFALKLGYTEKLVQAALQKLGPNPEQNELLAELIKLSAQHQSSAKLKIDSDCDSIDELNEQITQSTLTDKKLRPIIIDGSNIAMSHGNKEVFSCRGIKLCVDWFQSQGHTEITVFVPKWRKETPRPDNPVVDQEILHELERERLLVFTPSREVGGKRMVCYDDRYILKLAADNDGVVVSNDNYRDLVQECPEFRKVVEERILMYSFVNDRFMPPDDPLGRSGPTLDNFLKMSTHRKGGEMCPYGKKCTYGNKCKYNHPERGFGPQKSVTDRLVENAQRHLLARNLDSNSGKKLRGKSLSLPLQASISDDQQAAALSLQLNIRKQPLSRTKSTTVNNCKSDIDSSKSIPNGHFPTSSQSPPSPTSYYRLLYQMNHIPVTQGSEVPQSSPNVHRKLQRQLSINPSYDPRIYQAQRQFTSLKVPHHVPASRHYSYPDPNYLNPQHSNVTRIASAPPANPGNTLASDCSHLNSMWSVPYSSETSAFVGITSPNIEESRCKLHYHLASIFPEQQVDAAMCYYPTETNPQKICATILSMFPPNA